MITGAPSRWRCWRVLLCALLVLAVPAGAAGASAFKPDAIDRAILTGDYVRAFRELREAANSSNEQDRRNALIGFGSLYLALAEPNKARDYLQQARESLGRFDEGAARIRLLGLQAQLDILQTRYAPAREGLEQAYLLAQKSGDAHAIIEVQRILADLKQRQGDSAGAETMLAEATRLARNSGAQGALALLTGQQAALHASSGDYRQALDMWQRALELYRDAGFLPSEAKAVQNLGKLHLNLGLVTESVRIFSDALKAFRKLPDPAGEMRTLIDLGHAQVRLGDTDNALANAETALEIARKRHDYAGEGEALVLIGDLWLEHRVKGRPLMPDPNAALKHFKSALDIYREAGDRYAAARTYLRSGAAYLAMRQPRVAIRVLEEVASDARRHNDEETLWQALRGQGYGLARTGSHAEASRRYADAVEILERAYQRTAGLDRETRSAFLGDRRGLFEEYIDTLLRQGDPPNQQANAHLSFSVSELAKSRQFTEMIAGAGAERAVGRDNPELLELLQRERKLQIDSAEIGRAKISFDPKDSSTESSRLQSRQQEIRSELEKARSEIKRIAPKYDEVSKPQRFTVADIQAALDIDETLVSYFVMRDLTVAFVLGRNAFQAVRLNAGRSTVRQMVDRFRKPFAESGAADHLAGWKPEAAMALYEAVMAPLLPYLPKNGRLTISADDALYTIPFEALLTEDRTRVKSGGGPAFSEYATWPWLGDRYAIAYFPSAGALLSLRKEAHVKSWKNSLIAFADPDFGDDENSGNNLAQRGGAFGTLMSRSTGVLQVPRLPETAIEAAEVNKLLGGKGQIYLRRNASESKVFDLNLVGTRYLMFSTHGLLGGDFSNLGQPALAMSLASNPPGVDGFLTMSEVLGLKLNADLTVLSACNTAGEPENARGGEGFAGLTRSFMFAGSRSLLVSHWPVASDATVALIKAFFKELAAGFAKPEALARAKQKTRLLVQRDEQLAHPFFWAPFVLVGDAR